MEKSTNRKWLSHIRPILQQKFLIINYKIYDNTKAKKNAISFCNQILSEKFTGDIDNFKEVSNYLTLHLDEAKKKKSEPKKIILSTTRLSDYGSYINDYDLDNIDDPYWIIEQYRRNIY